MRCLACNVILSDREASRKFINHAAISNPEDRYIDLCDNCITDTGLNFVENSLNDNTHPDEDFDSEGSSDLQER